MRNSLSLCVTRRQWYCCSVCRDSRSNVHTAYTTCNIHFLCVSSRRRRHHSSRRHRSLFRLLFYFTLLYTIFFCCCCCWCCRCWLLYPHLSHCRFIEGPRKCLYFFYGCFLNTKHLHFKHSNTLFITLSYFLDKMRVCVCVHELTWAHIEEKVNIKAKNNKSFQQRAAAAAAMTAAIEVSTLWNRPMQMCVCVCACTRYLREPVASRDLKRMRYAHAI